MQRTICVPEREGCVIYTNVTGLRRVSMNFLPDTSKDRSEMNILIGPLITSIDVHIDGRRNESMIHRRVEIGHFAAFASRDVDLAELPVPRRLAFAFDAAEIPI